jgi:hypothetical protein
LPAICRIIKNEVVMKKRYLTGGVLAIVIAAAAYAAPGSVSGKGFAKVDANGDGSVTKTEVTAHGDARFAQMDMDGNGQIDQSDRQARLKARFAQMDADRNGSVTEAEFVAANEAKAKARKSQRISNGEGRIGKRGNNVGKWGRADTNNDKAISRSEYDAATLARFAARDKDGNGILSGEEMKHNKMGMRSHRMRDIGKGAQDPQSSPSDAG